MENQIVPLRDQSDITLIILCIMLAMLCIFFFLRYLQVSRRMQEHEIQKREAEIKCQQALEETERSRQSYLELKLEINQKEKELYQYLEKCASLSERVQSIEKQENIIQEKDGELQRLQKEIASYQAKLAETNVRLEEERKIAEEKLSFFAKAHDMLSSSFKAVSADTLKDTQNSFLEIAKATFEKYHSGMQNDMQHRHVAIQDLVKPLRESLDKVDAKIHELEKTRASAYAGVTEQLKNLSSTQLQLHLETQKLSRALRAPTVRGKWGEIQLKRVVEIAGMVEYCDFEQQVHIEGQESRLRPDLVVRLPNSRSIIVDAKAPLQAYLEAIESRDDQTKDRLLKEHARHLRKHLQELSDKSYWDSLRPTPEFVVLFLPGESFFSVALEHDPALIEYGVEKKVLLATPTTLIALLKAVAYGWREQVVAENALYISELGKLLYDRLNNMSDHFQKLKRSLDSSVESYNKAIGSFESRVLVAARKFQDVGVSESQKEIPLLEPVDKVCRSLESLCVDIE